MDNFPKRFSHIKTVSFYSTDELSEMLEWCGLQCTPGDEFQWVSNRIFTITVAFTDAAIATEFQLRYG